MSNLDDCSSKPRLPLTIVSSNVAAAGIGDALGPKRTNGFAGPRSRSARRRRFRAAGRALNDDRVSPPFAAMMNFNVLATTPSGQVPTTGELTAMLRTTGFEQLEWHDLPNSDERAVIGWKQK
jgi:hypothetical protein